MRIISSTGYGSTGSTAVTDLLSEYDSLVSFTKEPGYEFKFFHNPNGILNLEYYLTNCSITGTMHLAVINYLRLCEDWAKNGSCRSANYETLFKNRFMEYTYQYLKELGGDDYFVEKDFCHINMFQYVILRVINKIHRICYYSLHKKSYFSNSCPYIDLFSVDRKNYLYEVDISKFDKCTKKYFDNLFTIFSNNGIANVHELIPIHMIDHCSRWFDDIRIIASDRDPRDIYLTKKYIYVTPSHPCHDVKLFCKYYKWLKRNVSKVNKTRVCWIQLEDLIYKYDETVKKIEDFCDIESKDHTRKSKRFIPEKAIENCNLKYKFPNEKDNILYIENELKDYLYNFSDVV